MNNKNMWIPLVASIGVGAATYYAVSKNNQSIRSAVQQVLPIVSQVTNGSTQNSQS
ncbi:MAG TPA: hypothetical protein VK061_06955 [Bacillota bacterium]|nr:hypothetical protein [Bacillota bacterium]